MWTTGYERVNAANLLLGGLLRVSRDGIGRGSAWSLQNYLRSGWIRFGDAPVLVVTKIRRFNAPTRPIVSVSRN